METENKNIVKNITGIGIQNYPKVEIDFSPETPNLKKIEEPPLSRKEEQYKEELISAMENMINFDTIVEKKMDVLLEYIDRMFKVLAVELGLDVPYESYKKIFYYLARNFIGFNEVE